MEWTNENISVCSTSTEKRNLTNVIKESKVIVFDLDGTLYEGKSHFQYYANLIQLELPHEKQLLFEETYNEMLCGKHIMKIGMVYDALRDYIISISPTTLEVTSVCTWEGEEVEEGHRLYEVPFDLNHPTRVVVGDGWFFPVVAAVHYGLTDIYHCYDQTKEYMTSELFTLEQTKGLKEALVKLKETKKLVLVTNADANDVINLLDILSLTSMFDLEIVDALKPMNTQSHLREIMELYNVFPNEIISIGDNFINEVVPAVNLGMYGICLTEQEVDFKSDNFFTVPTLENLFE